MDHPIRYKVLGSVSITPRQMLYRGDSVTLKKDAVPPHIEAMVKDGTLHMMTSPSLGSVVVSFSPVGG